MLTSDAEPSTDSTNTITRVVDHLLGGGSDPSDRGPDHNNATQRGNADSADDRPPRSSRAARGETSAGRWDGRWDDLDAIYNLAYGTTSDSRNEGEPGWRERAPFVAFLSSRDWDDLALRRSNLADHAGIHQVPPQPDNTSGLTWSEDGRTL
jgi:hypothetical protein